MGRVLLALISIVFLVTPVMAGAWTPNNFLYQPATGARGDDEKAKFNSGLNRVDSRLANEKWLNDSPYNGDLSTAITSIGSAITVLSLPAGNWPIAVNLTIPANLTLKLARGALLSIPTGKTLTINGNLDAGLYQIFSCAGTGKVVYTGKKYPEWWGAKDDSGSTDCTISFNAACLNAGPVEVVAPNGGYYKITGAIVLPSNTTLYGHGYQSRIHSTNTTRLSGITATGTQVAPLSNIKVTGLRITGVAGTTQGVNAGTCGAGVDLRFCDDCEISGNYISEWSDSGISSLDGNRNIISNNNIKYTAQNIQVAAQAIDVYDNVISNNISGLTLFYTPIQTEGNFGGSGNKGVYGTTITGNTVYESWERGIVAQVSPNTTITGNTVRGGGLAGNTLNSGIHLYGAPNSSVTGNVSVGNAGYGIRLGANSTSSAVSGNTTQGNSLGSCLLTDDGVATSHNVAMGINSFAEGEVATSGNVSFLNRTSGFKFSNLAVADATTLDYYKEDVFTPVVVGTTDAGVGTYTYQVGRYTRIGNVVNFYIALAWTAHTGTGYLTITGLPFTSANTSNLRYPIAIRNNGLAAAAGYTIQGIVNVNSTTISLDEYRDTDGAIASLPMDGVVAGISISGSYLVQ